ncbi:hypothetical protein CDAR_40381 [Caerostris darwini]|uniref:Uncharacterized protein n=1 Tax=Caerostris darwini TaxID=1538125 RepID=A0AAV4RDL9_9ARAC|nr:hypothetical protein CDAR_40381 [Caerostris darwini]
MRDGENLFMYGGEEEKSGKRDVFWPKWSEGAAVAATVGGGWRHEPEAVWRSIRSHAVTAGATTLAVGRGDHGTLTRTLFLKHPLSPNLPQ